MYTYAYLYIISAYSGLEKYAGAIDAYKTGLKLEPNNEQMKKGLREAETRCPLYLLYWYKYKC